MPARRLIIGCGYLGRRVAQRWLDSGDHVTALTRSPERAAELRQDGIRPVVGDVTQPETLHFHGDFDSLLYCVGYDRRSDADKRAVSVGGPRNAAETLRGRVRQVVFTSTTGVYAQTDGEEVDEQSPTRPTGERGRIAVDAEAAMRTAEPPPTILRLAGLYGPGRLLSREQQLAGEVPMSGSPDQWLNLIHVDDAATACAAGCEGGWPALVLTCDNSPVRRADYYGTLASLRRLPGPRFDGEPRSRGDSNKRCRNDLLRTLLPELAFPSYLEGLADAVRRTSSAP